jgi:pimeloyl-ACP methyl ester carboxylesterase
VSDIALRHRYAHLEEVVLHYVEAGEGDALLLLHGWPQTWWEWRHVIPRLAERYRVIAPDLRGLGDSSRPLGGYDKRTLAKDLGQLMKDHLGLDRFHLVGHDWPSGSRRRCAAWPSSTSSSPATAATASPRAGGAGITPST